MRVGHKRSQTALTYSPGVGDYEVEKSISLVHVRTPQWSIYNSKVIKFPQSVVQKSIVDKFPTIGTYNIPEKVYKKVISMPYLRKY